MLDTQGLAIFAAVVQAGSISGAAARMNLDKSVVSRQLARLEVELGAQLVQRTTRRMALTEIGTLLYNEASRIEEAMGSIERLVRGKLRVSCPLASRRVMVPALIRFCERYADVNVNLQMEDRLIDLVAERIDVAIRTSQLADSTLIACKIADSPPAGAALGARQRRCRRSKGTNHEMKKSRICSSRAGPAACGKRARPRPSG
ncbi:LysR family transcriptional regulator [Variovorax paradoxus]|nr:LysR family transcriptional regulator [Variovorax paradoxus]